MVDQRAATNLQVFSAPEVASHYAALDYLTPCECFLFDTCIQPGMAILDVGVGGGRTTTYLSRDASRYVAVDYSKEMIGKCRSKFPDLEFMETDASDLSVFPDASFDAVVIAFNGLDYVVPKEKRWKCLRECRRVLRTGGVLIFSSHNPRAILIRPDWNRERLRAFARSLVAEGDLFFRPVWFALAMAKPLQAFGRAAINSAARITRRLITSAFWRGEGDLLDPAHGGLVTHAWIPQRATAELVRFGFQPVTVMGDDYPARSEIFVTDWYYYAFEKMGRSTNEGPCD